MILHQNIEHVRVVSQTTQLSATTCDRVIYYILHCITSHRLDPHEARVVGAFGLSHICISHIPIIYVGNYLPWGLRPRAK